jgi:hypothetical protein
MYLTIFSLLLFLSARVKELRRLGLIFATFGLVLY